MDARKKNGQPVFCYTIVLSLQILQKIQIFDGLTNLFAAGKRGEVTEMTLQQTPRSWQPLVRKQFSISEKIFTRQEKEI